jgi:hypothetical protein
MVLVHTLVSSLRDKQNLSAHVTGRGNATIEAYGVAFTPVMQSRRNEDSAR